MFKQILLFCFLIGSLHAQEIQLYVKSGTISVTGKTVTAGKVAVINQPTDWVKTEKTALVLAKKLAIVIELESGIQLSFREIDQKFKKRKSALGAFLEIALNQSQNKQNVGAAVRSIGSDPWIFNPMDSFYIMSDSLILVIGNEDSKIIDDVRLYQRGSKDTLTISELEIETPAPGFYYWDYRLKNRDQVKRFLNYFIVPDQEERRQLSNDLRDYKKSISKFSPEMQSVLLEEYYGLKKLYFKKP